MNKENAHLYLPLVQALADGKTLQYKSLSGWVDLSEFEYSPFDLPKDFRIKPEPRTFEMWLAHTGCMYPVSSYTSTNECERITVQEVLE